MPERLWLWLPGGCGCPVRRDPARYASEGPVSGTPNLFALAGGRRWARGPRGRGGSPATFPGPWVLAAAAVSRDTIPWEDADLGERGVRWRGVGVSRRQRLWPGPVGVGQRRRGLCADTCILHLGGVGVRSVDLGPGTYLCLSLCVGDLARLLGTRHSDFESPRWGWGGGALGGVFAYVVCACRRVWVWRPSSVCAPRASHRPDASLPRCPPGPRLGCKLFSWFLGQPPWDLHPHHCSSGAELG